MVLRWKSLCFDDLYNNLRVFESDVKGSTASSSSTQNVAFVSENTSSTNEVSTAYGVSNSSGHNSQILVKETHDLALNQLLMNPKVNPVFHSKTKHIEIRHHFIRDAYEKKLIQVALVKGRQDDLLYSLYGMLCAQKNLDNEKMMGKYLSSMRFMDFLTRSSIYYALTLSLVVSTTFVEQFWMSAKSKTINNVRYITATVAGKPVTISEASIRSDLLFDDADGIDTLNNQAIFDTI
ncbi:hypothetical protein Tco_0302939 [Tanacetum coccineum]